LATAHFGGRELGRIDPVAGRLIVPKPPVDEREPWTEPDGLEPPIPLMPGRLILPPLVPLDGFCTPR